MAGSYSNSMSRLASWFTARAHRPASMARWVIIIALALVWIVAGYVALGGKTVTDRIYHIIGAVVMPDAYFDADSNMLKEGARFAGLLVPVVGIFFAFSASLGRNLAHVFSRGAAKHVVITGDGPAAISLALDCRRMDDSVYLVGENFPEATALDLKRRGVMVLRGSPVHVDALFAARAHRASHVVALCDSDTDNLQVEAGVRRLVGNGKRRRPIRVHVATDSPLLLREAREMRAHQMRKLTGKDDTKLSIDPAPFSLDEIAARNLIQRESGLMLQLAEHIKCERLHFVFFGFDAPAQALAARLLMSMWSIKFGAPRLTVLTPDPKSAEDGFRARHFEAFAHPELWTADVAFLPFDWNAAGVTIALLQDVEAKRGKPMTAVVSTGSDSINIHISIALRRAANRNKAWPIPIFMHESAQTEFSRQFAAGDETEELDAFLQAFGGHQLTATRAKILDGLLDRGAAIAHEQWRLNLGERDAMTMRELQSALRDWDDVLETYRSANRAVADSAIVKMWDAGWRPAHASEQGNTSPKIPADRIEALARTEHDRWVAERLMSGWRATLGDEKRNNDLMAHDKLVGWDKLTDADRAKDAVQVRAAVDIARVLNPHGFVERQEGAQP